KWAEETYSNLNLTAYFIVNAPDDHEKIVGVCFCDRSSDLPDAYYVELLGVDPAYQGQRLGKVLLLRATQYAMENNARFISLHTWGGNLKAMPLYKRQGYKWRPDTTVYMENYIPQVLTFPLFQDIFAKYCWYDVFKPEITQRRDEEFEDKMAIYNYRFSKDEELELNVWIDRTIGRISGFHLKTAEENIRIKAFTPNSYAYIGIETFPVYLEIQNNSSDTKKFSVVATPTSKIQLSGETKTDITIEPKQTIRIELRGKFAPDTLEFDAKRYPQSYSDHEIRFDITYENNQFPLTIGKLPIHPIKVETQPYNFIAKPNSEVKIPIVIKNYMGEKIEVVTDVFDGKYVSFSMHHYAKTVSKYDTSFIIDAKIADTDSTVDYFKIVVSDLKGQKMLETLVPVVIFKLDRTLTYRIEQTWFIENKRIRVSLNENTKFSQNLIEIIDKRRDLRINGNPILLGMPFNIEGSEFYTTKLTHELKEEKEGYWVISTGESKIKEGIKVKRKLFIPYDDEPLAISYELINTSDKDVDNLGIHYSYWWWHMTLKRKIIPTKKGIVYDDLPEVGLELGKDPKTLSEGWIACEHYSGVIGFIFDESKIEKIGLDGRYPRIDYILPVLKAKEKYEFEAVRFYFAENWQTIRSKWKEIYGKTENKVTFHPAELKTMRKIGLSSTPDSGIYRGLVLDRTNANLMFSFDAYTESVLKGSINLDFTSTTITPKPIKLDEIKTKRHNVALTLSPADEHILSGKITYDTLSRIFDIQTALGFYDSSKKLDVKRVTTEKGDYIEVENGYLKFRGSEKFNGNLFYLSIAGSENYFLTFWPETPPYLWSSKFYGGITSLIRKPYSWSDEDYKKLKFEAILDVTKGPWKGFGFQSEIIEDMPSLKGLQVTMNYLTLPDSPFLLVQQMVTNHSEVTRYFDSQMNAYFETSKTTEDFYFVESNRKVQTYRIHETESEVWRQKDEFTSWTAYKKKDQDYFIGATISTFKHNQTIAPYVPNLSVASLVRHAKKVEIKPKETICLEVLFVVSKDLESIEPFTDSNIFELIKENNEE
ncbi:MAG: GNAT family N-acetyltransferase, partial [Candidatus Heimdallarchaeaceae archaeon]